MQQNYGLLLTLYHTMMSSDAPFESSVGQGENVGNHHFFPFTTKFSTCYKLSSANAFNLAKILSGTGLKREHSFLLMFQHECFTRQRTPLSKQQTHRKKNQD